MAQQGVPETVLADTLRQELQALLLAELEHRLQPVEGLIAALRLPHLSFAMKKLFPPLHSPQACPS